MRPSRWIHCCCLAACLSGAGAVQAEVDPTSGLPINPLAPGITSEDIANGIDATYKSMSRHVVDLGHRLDALFGGDKFERDTEGSMMRLSLFTQYDDEGLAYDPSIKLRLRLPNTERRLSLLIRSEEEEEDDIRRGIPVPPGAIDRNNRDYSAMLRFARNFAEDWNFDVDTGIRMRLPPNPFLRFRLERAGFVGRNEWRLSEELYWYRDRGDGARTRLLFQRPLSGPRFLRLDTEADWRGREGRWFYSHVGSVMHEFAPLHALGVQFSLTGESEPNQQVTSYAVGLRWRRNVMSKWLFLEVRPELVYLRENDFEMHPQLIVGLEAFFGDVEWVNAPPVSPAAP